MLERLVASLITGGARLLTGVRARWIGCGPSTTQRIYFANHTSHLDFVLLWSALPPRLRAATRPVAADDYWSENALRLYLATRVFRCVLIDRTRSDRQLNPIASMLEAVDRDDSLILFPEGSRGSGTELLPFKSGIFHLARERPGIEIVPVWMDNLYRVMPKGAMLPIPLLCRVTFGSPIHIDPDEGKTAFLDRLQERLLYLKTE